MPVDAPLAALTGGVACFFAVVEFNVRFSVVQVSPVPQIVGHDNNN